MKQQRVISFTTVIPSVIAVFLFSIAFAAPQARAYAIGSTTGSAASAGSGSAAGSSYDVGNSFQNLISPFTGFIDQLKWNNNTTINPSGASGTIPPASNLAPVAASDVQNMLGKWFSQFDNWFRGVTGVQLSGILVVM